jgi:hypothetical protein
MIHDFSPEAFVGGILIGIGIGMLLLAWTDFTDRRRIVAQREQAELDAAEARWDAAVLTEQLERARREIQWRGGYQ